MATRFTRFNRQQLFTAVPKDKFEQNVWLTAKEVWDYDMKEHGEIQQHTLVGAWKHDFSEDSRLPGAPGYKYTLGLQVGDKYYYVNAPSYMNKDFDAIIKDKSLVAEINAGHCMLIPTEFETRNDIHYGFDFV